MVRRYRKKYQERYDYKVFNREQQQRYADLGLNEKEKKE